MNDINNLVMVGRLVKDAVYVEKESLKVCNFTIANNHEIKNDNGIKESIGSFYDVELYGNYAKSLSEYLKKGLMICINGSLKQDTWEKDGKKYRKIVILASKVQLLNGKNKEEQEILEPDITETEDDYQDYTS